MQQKAMDSNGSRTLPPRHAGLRLPTQIELITPSASPEQAAAIVAAIERFIRATAPEVPERPAAVEEWGRAALLEGVGLLDEHELSDPWVQRDPWINT